MTDQQFQELIDVQRQILAELREYKRYILVEDQSSCERIIRTVVVADGFRLAVAFAFGLISSAVQLQDKDMDNTMGGVLIGMFLCAVIVRVAWY